MSIIEAGLLSFVIVALGYTLISKTYKSRAEIKEGYELISWESFFVFMASVLVMLLLVGK